MQYLSKPREERSSLNLAGDAEESSDPSKITQPGGLPLLHGDRSHTQLNETT